MKVMVVDDEKIIANHIVHIIEMIDDTICCDTFFCGNSAIDHYRNGFYDLVISDIKMPLKNGTDLLRWIDEHDPKPPPFCFISAGTSAEVKRIPYKNSIFFIKKPFNQASFEDLVVQTLKCYQSEKVT